MITAKKIRLLPDIAGVYCFVIFAALVTVGGKHALRAGDTFWHIKAGTAMLDRRALLTTDIFSHTAFGKPWLAHEWLSEILMAAIHRVAGLDGVALFFLLIAALTFWLLFRLLNHFHGEGLAAFSVTIAALLSLPHLLARPHIFTWLFGVATLYILTVRRDKLYLLPLISLVWANLHGGFLFGIVLQVFFIAGFILDNHPRTLTDRQEWLGLLGQSRKPLLILTLSILAIALLNPHGYKLFLFPFQVSKEIFMNNIGEWLAPNLRSDWSFRYFLLGIIFLFTFNRHRINWTNRLLLIFFINAALSHGRNISLAGLFLAPLLAELLGPWSPRISIFFDRGNSSQKQLNLSPLTGPLATVVLAASLLFVAYANYNLDQQRSPVIFPLGDRFPAQAAQYLKENPPAGKMLNNYFIGGYLIYTLGPAQKVFIDGRADMYGEKIFGDYGKIVHLDKDADKLLSEYGVDWIIYPVDKPLIRYLKKGGGWAEIYRDEQVAILERHNSES